MHQLILLLIGILCCIQTTKSQDKPSWVGTWEDVLSNNETSFQLVIKDAQHFVFASVAQSNLIDSIAVTRDKIYHYKWLSPQIICYAKLPDLDPFKAAAFPPQYSLMRIDKQNEDELIVSLCDRTFSKTILDSIINAGTVDKLIGERMIQYRKLDLNQSINEAIFMGLWQAPATNDSTKYQLFVQKNKLGFLKIAKKDFKQATVLKPNKGYHYQWIDANTLYYYKEKATGFVKADKNPNKYALMRIDEISRRRLSLTISTRKFDRAGLNYIIKEGDLSSFFRDNVHRYQRSQPIKKAL
jgi:hypothetical protein